MLRQELREPANYFNIIKEVASGRTAFGDIVSTTGLDKSLVSKYLANLQELRVVEKEHPVTDIRERRNASYRISDNYMAFWFRFVYRNRHLIEQDKQDSLIRMSKNDLEDHFGRVFERVCGQLLGGMKMKPFEFARMGRWWEGEQEIDIVAINDATRDALFVECKWGNRVDAPRILSKLESKADEVVLGGKKYNKRYAIAARSFRRTTDDAMCLTLDELLASQG